MFKPSRLVSLLGAASIAGGLTLAGVALTTTAANAAGPNNPTVSQTAGNNATSGHTTVTLRIVNHGSTAATGIVFTGQVKTTSPGLGVLESYPGLVCGGQGPVAGVSYQYSCYLPSIAAGATVSIPFNHSGTAGTAFSSNINVGELSPGETTRADNVSNISSYYGPRADIRLSQAVQTAPAPTKTHRVIVAKVVNAGPSTANNMQYTGEIKSTGFSSVLVSSAGTTCQFIPPATGFQKAFVCTRTGALATGATWQLNITNTGTAGAALQLVGKATAQSPADPVAANNSATTNTTYAP